MSRARIDPAGVLPPTFFAQRATIQKTNRPRVSTVAGVLADLAVDKNPRRDRILLQFIKCWNRWPQHREGMLVTSGPLHGDPFDIAAICAVVHTLCERDGFDIPPWVEGTGISPPKTISGRDIKSSFTRYVVSRSPALCETYGVFFERETLDL